MPEVKYGELASWDDADISDGNDFMNLAEGDNKVRVFTNPYQFVVHWVKDVTGANRKVKCAINGCPLCKKGLKTQYRWYVGVIHRKTGQAKILEISSQIYKGIKDHISDPEWGDVKKYDINIKRGAKGSQPLYRVLGSPNKSKLTSDEQELVMNFLGRVNLSKLIQPSTPEEVSQKMGATSDEPPRVVVGTQTVEVSGAGVKPTIDDEEFSFGDEEGDEV